MRLIRFTTLLALALSIFSLSIDAQKRKPAPRATSKSAPTNSVVSAAKLQVSNQLYNVNVFVDKIGPIAVAIEAADRDAAARKLDSKQIAANETNKQKIIAAIRGLCDGLVKLESDFRTKPQLSQYLSKIQGISGLCAEAEDSAIAGKFIASKDPLRRVALKLNDTLAVLPGPLPAGASAPIRSSYPATSSVPTRTVSSQTPATGQTRIVAGEGEPTVGMSTAEVSATTWGKPTSKRNSRSANGSTEVWVYSGKGTVYFFNGKVSQIVR
jgi:hypothetical protein